MRIHGIRQLAVVAWLGSLAACSPGGEATGAAALRLEFATESGALSPRGALSGVVDSVRVSVSHRGTVLLEDTFDYEGLQGTLDNIPAGSERFFLAEALAGTTVVYRGNASGVTVAKGETVPVAISMLPAYTDDVYAPATVADLQALAEAGGVRLGWTAVGDDAFVGRAARYDIRWSAATIQEGNFASAAPLTGAPAPGTVGSTESFLATGLPAGATIHFALKAVDDANNVSAMSNEAVATTLVPDNTPPAAVVLVVTGTGDTSLTIGWTAPGDDGTSGTADRYDVRWSTVEILGDTEFEAATPVAGVAAPQAAGSPETLTIEGLPTGQEIWVALKTADEVLNWSPLSNVVSGTPGAPDTTAPAQVTDLAAIPGDGQVTLSWTAPGDDADVGTAAAYEIRYSQGVIDDTNFNTATLWDAPPTPQLAGSSEQAVIAPTPPLTNGVEYTFALIAIDEAGNPSPLSNVAPATPDIPDTTPPADVVDLAIGVFGDTSLMLSWTAPGDDDTSGTVAGYDVRWALAPIDATNWAQANQVAGPATPVPALQTETLVVGGLPPGSHVYLRLLALDGAGNPSGLSNEVSQQLSCVACPAIAALRPAAAPVGGLVEVQGAQFGASAGTLTVGAQTAVVVSWADDSIWLRVPASVAGTVPIAVDTATGSDSADLGVSPTLDSLTPDTFAALPASMVIDGSGFGAAQGGSTVAISGAAGDPVVTSWSDTSLEVTVPAGTVTGPVSVTVDGLESNLALLTSGTARDWSSASSLGLAVERQMVGAAVGGDLQLVIAIHDGADLELQALARVGGAWQTPVDLTTNDDTDQDPSLVADAGGTCHVVWQNSTSGVQASSGLGDTWSTVQTLDPTLLGGRAAMGVLPSGEVIAVWPVNNTGEYHWSVRDPAGGTWGAFQAISFAANAGRALGGAVDPAGRFHLIGAVNAELHHWVYDGGSFQDLGNFATVTNYNNVEPHLVADRLGELHALWSDSGAYYTADWDGEVWSTPVLGAGLSTSNLEIYGIALAIDAAGVLHAAVDSDETGDFDVIYLQRVPGGDWTLEFIFFDTQAAWSSTPLLAITPDLVVDLLWWEAGILYHSTWE